MPSKKRTQMVPCPEGTGRWGAIDRQGNFIPDLKLDIHPFDKDKAVLSLELLRLGKTEAEIVKDLGVSRLSLSRWRREHPEFGEEYKIAKQERAEGLLEKSYDQDMREAYGEGENVVSISAKAKRAKMVAEHVKQIKPESFGSAPVGPVTININVDKHLEKKAERFVWEVESPSKKSRS